MAESILRLTVSSDEYNNKLKQATNGLTRYIDECRKAGGTLEVVEKETLDYVRAIGQMDTTSRTATGKLAEMKKTFTELSAQYKQLTDAEKQSPFGKALAGSLDMLKGRVAESKSQLDDINKSINGSGGLTGALDGLLNKFGMSIQSLAGWGTALAAGKAALDVAKDAFFASEATVDEWGRVMDSSKSLYEGFLTALNTGDISGYLGRIDEIVTAARKAYDELDRLGTMRTIQAPKMSAQQTENERMRMMIQTGRYIAPVDGRRASMKDGQLLTPDQIRRIKAQLQNGMKNVVTLVGNEVRQTGKAIDAVYNRQAQELGMSLKEFRKGTSSMAEFDKRMAGYEQYQKWRNENYYTDNWGNRRVKEGNPFEEYKKWGTFRVDGERYNDLVRLIQQRDQQAAQAYGMQSQAYRTMNRAEGVTVSKLMRGETTGGGTRGGSTTTVTEVLPVGSVAALTKEMQELRKEQSKVTNVSDWLDYEEKIKDVNNRIKELKGELGLEALRGMKGVSVSDGVQLPTRESILKKGDAAIRNFKTQDKPTKQEVKLTDIMSQMNGGISSMTSGIEQLGFELPQGMKDVLGGIQAVTTILSGISTIVAAIEAISAADTIIPFANGGVVKAASGYRVPGRTFSGDMIPARLNAGETVLNQAQAGVIANALQDREFGGGSGMMQPYVDGEKIFLGMNNTSKRMGRGEIVTTGTLRRLGLI